MARIDTAVGNTQVTGAAASVRYRWPEHGNNGGSGNALAHLGTVPDLTFSVVSYAGGGQARTKFAGAAAVAFKSTVAAGNGFGINWGSNRIDLLTARPGGTLVHDFRCMSIRATIAYDLAAGASLLDHGICIFTGNQNSMFPGGANPSAGVQFGCTGLVGGLPEYRLRSVIAQAGAVVVNDIVSAANSPSMQLFNTYEIRYIGSPNAATDPVFFALLNNVVVTPKHIATAGAGLFPPPDAQGGGQLGYNVGCLNISAANFPNMYVSEFVLTFAQSEGDLL